MEIIRKHKDLKQENRERWKLEIMKAAATAFKEKGYNGATMDDIAAQLGVSKASLYYYFKNKEAILFECNIYTIDVIEEMISEVDQKKFAPRQKIYSMLKTYMEVMLKERIASVVILAGDALSEGLMTKVLERRRGVECWLREVIADGIKAKEFYADDPKLMSFAVLGAMNWAFRWYRPTGEKSPEEISRCFADFILRGLSKYNEKRA